MIWLVMGILVLAVLLFVTKPLYVKTAPAVVPDTEVADYLEEIEKLDAEISVGGDNVEALEASKHELQRGLLASKSKSIMVDSGRDRHFTLCNKIFGLL